MTHDGGLAPSFLLMPSQRKSAFRREVLLTPQAIEQRILLIRGRRVMLDVDLSELYGVATRTLNQGVARNAVRFPADFAFHLTPDEAQALRSQSVISKGRGGRRRRRRRGREEEVAAVDAGELQFLRLLLEVGLGLGEEIVRRTHRALRGWDGAAKVTRTLRRRHLRLHGNRANIAP